MHASVILLLVANRLEAGSIRPNVLVIITDQQSATDMGVAGNPWVRTPNLDQLAERGVRFATAYAANPVCVPSKFVMHTGVYASQIGVRYNEQAPDTERNNAVISNALGWIFRRSGYETVFGGKIHLPGCLAGPITKFGYAQLGRQGEVITNANAANDRQLTMDMWSEPGLLADAGAKFLMNRKPDAEEPFFLFLSFESPHHDICYFTIKAMEPETALAKNTPHRVIELEKEMHEIEQAEGLEKFFSNPSPKSPGFDPKEYAPPLPANFEPMQCEPQAIRNLLALRPFRERARRIWGAREWREHRWMYARLTDEGDIYLGTVLRALQSSGLEKNTVVVFLSDHGENDGSHRLDHKTVFYNESSRVPFIFAGDGISAGMVNETTVSLVDLYPTLCDLAGIKAPEGLPGISLKPYLYGRRPQTPRKYVFLENQIGFMVTDGRFKYAWYDDISNDEMFTDLKDDPGEEVNLMPEIWKGGYRNFGKYIELRGVLLKHLKHLEENGAKIDLAGLEKLISSGKAVPAPGLDTQRLK